MAIVTTHNGSVYITGTDFTIAEFRAVVLPILPKNGVFAIEAFSFSGKLLDSVHSLPLPFVSYRCCLFCVMTDTYILKITPKGIKK